MSCGRSYKHIIDTFWLTAKHRVDIKCAVATKPLYGWDEAKRVLNLVKHKIDFTAAENFDWTFSVVEIDDRENYGELREIASGFIGDRLHVLIFTRRDGVIWIISLRKADKPDVRRYVEKIKRRMGGGTTQGVAPARHNDRRRRRRNPSGRPK